MKNLIKDREDIEISYVFNNSNIEVQGRINYMPIYMIMFIKKEEIKDFYYPLDDITNSLRLAESEIKL